MQHAVTSKAGAASYFPYVRTSRLWRSDRNTGFSASLRRSSPPRQSCVRRALLAWDMVSTDQFWWPVALSTMAGLSTGIGAVIAVVRRPSQDTMAGLLGVAMGVMATVSAVELIGRNAAHNDPFLVCGSAVAGALAYYLAEPYFPTLPHDPPDDKREAEVQPLLAPLPAPVGEAGSSDSDLEGGAWAAASSATVAQRRRGGALVKGPHPSPSTRQLPQAPATSLPAPPPGFEPGSGTRSPAPPPPPLPLPPPAAPPYWQGGGEGTGATAASARGGTLPTWQGAAAAAAGGGGQWAGSSPRGLQLASPASPPSPLEHHSGGTAPPTAVSSRAPAAAESRGGAGQAGLLRLGLLMAVTMTLHNMPEGFAVAFSAYTSFGPIMAVAIALHNIPEGIIIAAPIYAATGSRAKALGLAVLSGLSEPLGAVLALLVLHPFITPDRLSYLLAAVGGLMLAVCVIELWPEARACKDDRALAWGILLGAVVMGCTLAVEGA